MFYFRDAPKEAELRLFLGNHPHFRQIDDCLSQQRGKGLVQPENIVDFFLNLLRRMPFCWIGGGEKTASLPGRIYG